MPISLLIKACDEIEDLKQVVDPLLEDYKGNAKAMIEDINDYVAEIIWNSILEIIH